MMEKEIKILLSYHRHDIEWRDFFANGLKPFQEQGRLYVLDGEVTESSQIFPNFQGLNPGSQLFDFIILLISKKYLSLNDVIEKEIPEKILPLQEYGTHIIPVYVEDCSWQSISWLREMKLWPTHHLPFSNMTDQERGRFLSRFIEDELKLPRAEDTNVHASKSIEIGDRKGMKANMLKAENRLEESLNAYEQIIYEHPEDVLAKIGKAEVLKMMGRLDEALMGYTQIIHEYPEDFVAKIGKAEVLKMMNRLEESLNAYEQIIYEYPENVVAKNGRADVLMRLGRLSQAPEDETLNKGRAYDGDDDFERVFRDNLIAFLINEKKFPRESLNHGIVAEAPDLDLTVTHPDTDSILAIFNFKSENYGINFPKLSESMTKAYKKGFAGKYNPFVYIVYPSEESNEDFVIFEVEGDGTSHEISYGDFPAYNQLLFASPLSDPGRRICRNLTIFAKHEHGVSVDAPCQDYINLQIKKNKRTVAQIHRLNDSDKNIALVLAGYQKDFPKVKLPTYMLEGEVKQLSGYTSKSQGERNWLKGNLGHKQLKYEAGVYILKPGALVLNEIENEVSDLLELAKKNAERDKEPEEIKVSKYGKGHIATIQMDRISEVDLLGRERLVRAFAGMFVHTEEVEGFTVALLGDWGEGKSTMMKLLRKNLNEKHNGRFEFATFNAWEYERTDNIAAGLAQEVVNGLIEPLQKHFCKRQILRFKFALKEYKGELCRLAGYSIVAIFIILISHFYFENNTLKGLGLAGGIAALIFLLFKNLPTIIEHPIAIKLETYLKLPNYGKHLGDIPIIQSHLKTLCSLRLVDNKKLIVFIDDLDRCQTDCIARALDAIRLVMSIQNVIVMIGIDYRIAFKAMENYYEKLGDEERKKSDIARDYLGKIIQLPVRLVPSGPEEVRKYIEKRLFPNAQIMEDIEKDAEIDTERDVIEQQKLIKERIEAEGEEVKVRIPDDKKVEEPKSVEEILKDTSIERDMFSDLAQRFNFTNPRQLLRLRNSYRFLKVMDSDEKYDREILMKILFWHEFLNNWPSIIRDQCEKSVPKQESLEKIEKPEAKQIVQGVQEDILKIIEMPMYEEIERFVRIVVLPHSEEGVLEAREEIVK